MKKSKITIKTNLPKVMKVERQKLIENKQQVPEELAAVGPESQKELPPDPRGKVSRAFAIVCHCGVSSMAIGKGGSDEEQRNNCINVFKITGWEEIDQVWTCPTCVEAMKTLAQAPTTSTPRLLAVQKQLILPEGYRRQES